MTLFPTSWHHQLLYGNVLLNRQPPALAAHSRALPVTVILPSNFTEFDNNYDLQDLMDGPSQHVQFTNDKNEVVMRTATMDFALVPVSEHEYRFAGWTEQRTIRFDPSSLQLTARRGNVSIHHTTFIYKESEGVAYATQ
jgi:aspartate beta-hydroxylase